MVAITDSDRMVIKEALPELDLIGDEDLRDKTTEALTLLWKESNWDDIYVVPYLTERPEVSWVVHTRFVARGSATMAGLFKELTGKEYDRDLIVAAALLHDASKFQEYAKTDDGYDKSELGYKIQHSLYAAHVALNVGLPLDVVHLIVSHTPMAFVKPKLPEGWILREVDGLMLETLMNMSIDQYVSGYYGKPGS